MGRVADWHDAHVCLERGCRNRGLRLNKAFRGGGFRLMSWSLTQMPTLGGDMEHTVTVDTVRSSGGWIDYWQCDTVQYTSVRSLGSLRDRSTIGPQ